MYQKMYAMKTIVEQRADSSGNVKFFFYMADNGQKIVIKRRNKQAYVLTPISADDLYFTPEMVNRIKESQQEIKEREYTSFNKPCLDKP